MSDFWEAYRDPRWQRKRLDKMNQAEFACEICTAEEKTLNVHHRFYRKGAKPWEYELSELVCLCEACHKWHHTELDSVKYYLGQLNEWDLQRARGYIIGLYLQKSPDTDEGIPLESIAFAWGLASAYEIGSAEQIMDVRLEKDGQKYVNHTLLKSISGNPHPTW